MKRLLLIFLFSSIGCINSFSQIHFPEESILNDNDSSRIKLLKKLKVKAIIEKTYGVNDSTYGYFTTYYDKRGYDTLYYSYYKNGYTQVFRKYDFNGNMTEENYYVYWNWEGKLNLAQTLLYKRNQNGRLDTLYITGYYSYFPGIEIYSYDRNQNLIKKTTLDTNRILNEFEKYNYDSYRNLTKKLNITYYNMDTNIYFYKYYINKPINLEKLKDSVKEKFDWISIKIYDKELRLVEKFSIDPYLHFYQTLSRTYNQKSLLINEVWLKGGEEAGRINYAYNKTGKLIKEERFEYGIRQYKRMHYYNKNGTLKEIIDYALDDSPEYKTEYFYIF
jgi:hypothetical protein